MALWIVDIQPAKRLAFSGEAIVEVIRNVGHDVIETNYDPANGHFPYELQSVFESKQPLILRGSVGFAAWAHDNWSIRPGAFRSNSLRASVWLPMYGALSLNSDAIMTTYADFNTRRAEYENLLGGSLFIKPADGGKLLCGTVLEAGRSLFDAHYSQHRSWANIPANFRVLIARVQPIFSEWRFVLVGENVAAGSQYKSRSMSEPSAEVPPGAEATAKAIAKHSWRPTDVFVADIAETEEGFRLLELNTFGTSGLYACNLAEIVRSVSHYAI